MFLSQKGTAMLTGMIITLAIVGLTGSYLVTSFSYHSYQEAEADKKIAEYRAIEASEKMRNFVYNNYRNPPVLGLGLKSWLVTLRDGSNDLGLTVPAGHFLYRFAPGVPANASGHEKAYPFDQKHGAWITAVSAPDSSTHWVEIEGYGEVEGSGLQGSKTRATVVQRISFGNNNIFQNAMLTKTVNCMGCHLHVRGDVGVLGFFRPGWGTEGVDGSNSGDGSIIEGNIYAASLASHSALKQPSQPVGQNSGYFISTNSQYNIEAHGGDYFDARRANAESVAPNPTDGFYEVNGLKVVGDLHTTADNIGNRLPQDEDGNGERDFPNVNPIKAEKGATGQVSIAGTSGGKIYSVPPTENFTGAPAQEVGNITKTADGSVVLIGTFDDPIQLNGNVFIEGDVMIKGYVTGQGAIYSGRNLYVLGDIQYKNPPTAYKNSSDPDADAAADVATGFDELRLAARNSVVIGDFTRDNDAGTGYLPISQRQGEDFIKAQFGLGGTGIFRKGTGEELRYDSATSTYYNDMNVEIPASEVVTKSGDNYYNAAIMPTRIDDAGNINFWISQQNIRNLIETENLTMNSWRGGVSGDSTAKKNFLMQNGFTSTQATAIGSGTGGYNGGNFYVRKDSSGSFTTYRVILDSSMPYTKAVGKIDAFLYATNRIAGKVSAKNLVINGGLIAEKIGILAPGRKKEWWMGNSRYNVLNPNLINPFNDEKFGELTINYDYRLRNGGLGFELLNGEPGQRLFFQIKK